MKLSFVLAVIIAASVNARKVYRNRHLTTYEEVCFPSSPPVAPPVQPPIAPIPVPVPTGKGKGGGTVDGPTSRSAPVPCPPGTPKSGPSPNRSGPSPYKSGPSPPRSNPSPPRSGPSPKSGPSYTKSGPVPCGSCGTTSKSGPSPSKSGSSSRRSGPSPRRSGPSPSKSGPSPSKSGPAPGCTRFLQFAAAALGFGSSDYVVDDKTKQQTISNMAHKHENPRELQVISLKTTFQQFGSYTLPNLDSSAVLTWPDFCFDATIKVRNFIPGCTDCSFVVADSSQDCNPTSFPAVTPFLDPTEVTSNPYATTVFNTDANGNADVNIANICTGTGPGDNVERPLLLLDRQGQIAACGILSYVCP